MCVCVRLCVCMCVYLFVCVCVRERPRTAHRRRPSAHRSTARPPRRASLVYGFDEMQRDNPAGGQNCRACPAGGMWRLRFRRREALAGPPAPGASIYPRRRRRRPRQRQDANTASTRASAPPRVCRLAALRAPKPSGPQLVPRAHREGRGVHQEPVRSGGARRIPRGSPARSLPPARAGRIQQRCRIG